MVDDLVDYVSDKVIRIIMVEVQDGALEVNRLEFIKGDTKDADFYIDNYDLFVSREETKKITEQYDDMLKIKEDNNKLIKTVFAIVGILVVVAAIVEDAQTIPSFSAVASYV